jgi:hypothetical protein
MISKRSHTMQNLYKSLKEFWKCFRFSLVSIGSSISSVGTTCCHPCSVTRMGPKEVPAVSASSTFGYFFRVPTTSPAVISRVSTRLILVGGEGIISSPVNISGLAHLSQTCFPWLAQHLKCPRLVIDNARVSLGTDDWMMVALPGMSINAPTFDSFSSSEAGPTEA